MEPSWANKMWTGDQEYGNERRLCSGVNLQVSFNDCVLHSQASFAPNICGIFLTSIPWERYKMLILNKWMKFYIAWKYTQNFNDLVLLLVGKCILGKILWFTLEHLNYDNWYIFRFPLSNSYVAFKSAHFPIKRLMADCSFKYVGIIAWLSIYVFFFQKKHNFVLRNRKVIRSSILNATVLTGFSLQSKSNFLSVNSLSQHFSFTFNLVKYF